MSSFQPAHELCYLGSTTNRGLSLNAKEDIPRGAVISDELVIVVDMGNFDYSDMAWGREAFWAAFRNRPAEAVEAAMVALREKHPEQDLEHSILERLPRSHPDQGITDLVDLFLTNCLPEFSKGESSGLIFGSVTCTLNHSCTPNAALIPYHDPDDSGKIYYRVLALSKITRDTEITVSYLEQLLPSARRQSRIVEQFAFSCRCSSCEDESDDVAGTWEKIEELEALIYGEGGPEVKRVTPWCFFRQSTQLEICYLNLQILDDRCSLLLEQCASVAAYHSDGVRTCYFIGAVISFWKPFHHPKMDRYLELLLHPQRHSLWGQTEMGLSSSRDAGRMADEDLPRIRMLTTNDEAYDRIVLDEEAARKREADLAERQRLADEAAQELLAEEEAEQASKTLAAAKAATKRNKKRSQKARQKQKRLSARDRSATTTDDNTNLDQTDKQSSSNAETHFNAAVEDHDSTSGWEVVREGHRRSRVATARPTTSATGQRQPRSKRGRRTRKASVEEKRERGSPGPKTSLNRGDGEGEAPEKADEVNLTEAPPQPLSLFMEARKLLQQEQGAEERGDTLGVAATRVEESGGKEEEEAAGFMVGKAAIEAEAGTLGRLRSSSDPGCLQAAVYDPKTPVLRGVGGQFLQFCGGFEHRPAY